jgi:hypothetical protein
VATAGVLGVVGIPPRRGAFFRFAGFATPLARPLAPLSLWLTLGVRGYAVRSAARANAVPLRTLFFRAATRVCVDVR